LHAFSYLVETSDALEYGKTTATVPENIVVSCSRDLSSIGESMLLIEWQKYAKMIAENGLMQ
jgi:hypothetical protein